MAMNKKERQAYADLQQQLRLAKALRWTEPVAEDLDYPTAWDKLTKGFSYAGCVNVSLRVAPGCSNSHSHSFGRTDKANSQGAAKLFSTRLSALRAVRHRIEVETAEALLKVDQQIEDELAKEPTP